jgi:hypothetical protein
MNHLLLLSGARARYSVIVISFLFCSSKLSGHIGFYAVSRAITFPIDYDPGVAVFAGESNPAVLRYPLTLLARPGW